MTRFVWSQLVHRPSRTATLGIGILVAAVGFTVLTSAAETSALEIRGTIAQNFRGTYDILVRPTDSFSPIEREEGVVAPNFASGIFGGISLRQWRAIETIPGVDVAAPIANIGYVIAGADFRLPLERYLTKEPWQLYRVRPTWVSNRGLSRYPYDDQYVYVMRRDRLVQGDNFGPYEKLPGGRLVKSCGGFQQGEPSELGPDIPGSNAALWCFSIRSPHLSAWNVGFGFKPGEVGAPLFAQFPIMIAAVDPQQEDRLVGLDRAVVSGRRLTADMQAVPRSKPSSMLRIPVIASTRDFITDNLRVQVDRLRVRPTRRLPTTLASWGAYDYVTHLDAAPLGSRAYTATSLYRRSLGQAFGIYADTYWTASPVRYEGRIGDQIQPLTTTNPDRSYELSWDGFLWDPANRDLQFRHITNHRALEQFPQVIPKVVGRYDPYELQGFSSLTRTALPAYTPPLVQPATTASRDALGGGPLHPTMNLGGYIQQPPLMLTTLDAAKAFFDPEKYSGASGSRPISVIRVVVSGVTGPDPVSLARIKAVAQLIVQRTGLAVDITAGSSATTVQVHLPAGRFGSPPLDVEEAWVKKGVAVTILQALDRKSVALFVLVLAVTVLFLVNGALASVRTRRSEIGTLRALGWSRAWVFRAVLAELTLIGFAAGVAGTAIAAALVTAFGFRMPLARTLLVAPVATVLAAAAGLVPAWRASRSSPIDAVRPVVALGGPAKPVRGVGSMALANLRRLPSRTFFGAAGLFVGVGALSVLLSITLAFRGTLVGTALGSVISIQVRRVDYVAIGLALALAALSVADVLFLNLKDRAREVATLLASGWGDAHLVRLVGLEGLGIGLLGSVVGAVVGAGLSAILGVSATRIVAAGAIASLVGVLVAVVASLVPASLASRMALPTVLAEE